MANVLTSKSSSFLHGVGQLNNTWNAPIQGNTPAWWGQGFISSWWEWQGKYYSGSLSYDSDYRNGDHTGGAWHGNSNQSNGPLMYASTPTAGQLVGSYGIDITAISESANGSSQASAISSSIIHSGSDAFDGLLYSVEGLHDLSGSLQDYTWHRVNSGAGFKLLSIVLLGDQSRHHSTTNGSILVYNSNPSDFAQLAYDIGVPAQDLYIPNPALNPPLSKSVIDLTYAGIPVYNMGLNTAAGSSNLVSTLPSFSAGSALEGSNGWCIKGQ